MTFGSFEGGRLWVHDPEMEFKDDVVWRRDRQGRELPGRLEQTFQSPLEFSPHTLHATEPWSGERWCLTAYQVRRCDQVDDDSWTALRRLKFPLPRRMSSRTFGVECESDVNMLMSSTNREPPERREDASEHVHTPQDQQPLSRDSERQVHSVAESQPDHSDGSSDCTKEERGVCQRDCVSVCSIGRRASSAHGGSLEGAVGSVEAQEKLHHFADRLEEVRSDRPSGLVCEQGGGGSQPGPGRTLDAVEETPVHHGTGNVGGRHEGGNETRGGCSHGASFLPGVPNPDDGPDQSTHERRVFWLPSIPSLSRNSPDEVQWKADGTGATRADEDHRVSRQEEERPRDHHGGQGQEQGFPGEEASGTHGAESAGGIFRRILGPDRDSAGRVFRRGFCGREKDLQHEPDGGRDRGGAAHPGAEAQGGGEQVSRDGESEGIHQKLSATEVRHRIEVGQSRRADMKKGTFKRLLGNTRALVAGVFISTVAMLGAAMEAVPLASRLRPDVLEVCEGRAQMSASFSRWGWSTAKPVRVGSDLCDSDARDELARWIDSSKPRLVIMSNCCPRNPPVYPGHRNTSQAERRARKWRERQRGAVEFIHRIFDLQLARGDQAMAELPFGKTWGVESMAKAMTNHPGIRIVLGPKSVATSEVRDTWLISSSHIADEIEGDRERRRKERSACQNARIEEDTRRFVKAICCGYVQYLKQTDPGRIRKMLRSVAARIRRGVHSENSAVTDLRWSEKTVAKALKRWHAVFAQEDGEMESDGDEEMIPDPQEPNPSGDRRSRDAVVEQPAPPIQSVRSGLSSEGVSFEVPPGRRVSDAVKRGLVKAHCNLGHPSVADLQRFLKLGGARQEVVEAAGWMKCMTCAHGRQPATRRVSSIPPCQVTFGDEVQLDCICIHDSDKHPHWFLSVIYRATSYHIVELLRDHSPAELLRGFDRAWMKWAGPPLRATTDLEGGFQGREFWEAVGESGCSLSAIAGTAHWQQGKIERHNRTVKDMIINTIRHTQARGREEMRKLAREVACAKNSLVREHGWSPMALVFGREPRMYGELHHNGNPGSYHPSVGEKHSDVAIRMRYRYHANLEYIRSQARQMLLKTAHHRTRRLPIPKIGQLVFFWRDQGSKKRESQSKWVGPGYIVGLQDKNALGCFWREMLPCRR